MAKARERDFHYGRLGGGLTFYPYQFAIGLTVRYWPCLYAPSIRIHFGPAKAWLYLRMRR
jgi:hypothetical protein